MRPSTPTRYRLRAALAAFAISGLALVGNEWTLALKDVAKKVPRLVMLKDGRTGFCSAVVVNEGIAVTAAHCVETKDKQTFDLTLNDAHAEVEKVNRILDLAVIKFEPNGEIPVKLAKETPEPGTPIAVVGYPFGIEDIAPQFGAVAISRESSTKLLWLNVDLIFGDSGGAVLNQAGELVGINSSIFYAGPAHMAAAVRVEQVRDFAKKFLPKETK